MPLITRENSYGIDKSIDVFQKYLYEKLSNQFGTWNCYPRVYKNKIHRDNKTVVTAQHEENNNYTNVLFNDKVNMQSFFIRDSENTPLKQLLSATTSVSLIMQCNLDSIYSNEKNRTDERLKEDIVSISRSFADWQLVNIVDGIENVYREFYNDDLQWSNIEPRHVVRFEYDLLYSYKNCIL